jgi:cytochrome c-type biogenesis protein CcmE
VTVRTIVLVVALAGMAGWVATSEIPRELVYYRTPTELLSSGSHAPIRLGGWVEPGSVVRSADGVSFVLSDGRTTIPVQVAGSVPDLFAEGRGAIVEGALDRAGTFEADDVMVKHSAVYSPPVPPTGAAS